eukprot:TRINITY_DN68116_c10_g2_i8.p1 TRINITY_DN68116_c10_g2~~TRINITY_DN68116_c10_g2_i8.p1  ORF type:complete len:179 (+),score=25.15 TRINITY_DN68116_c10_g2_i8:872-1408(+)
MQKGLGPQMFAKMAKMIPQLTQSSDNDTSHKKKKRNRQKTRRHVGDTSTEMDSSSSSDSPAPPPRKRGRRGAVGKDKKGNQKMADLAKFNPLRKRYKRLSGKVSQQQHVSTHPDIVECAKQIQDMEGMCATPHLCIIYLMCHVYTGSASALNRYRLLEEKYDKYFTLARVLLATQTSN